MINTAVSASEKSTHMSHDAKEDLYDWVEYIWLNNITDENKKAEILDNFRKGDIEGMNSGLGFVMENERKEGRKEERMQNAKSLLDILDIKIIKEMCSPPAIYVHWIGDVPLVVFGRIRRVERNQCL